MFKWNNLSGVPAHEVSPVHVDYFYYCLRPFQCIYCKCKCEKNSLQKKSDDSKTLVLHNGNMPDRKHAFNAECFVFVVYPVLRCCVGSVMISPASLLYCIVKVHGWQDLRHGKAALSCCVKTVICHNIPRSINQRELCSHCHWIVS